jgi:hypothetical protein
MTTHNSADFHAALNGYHSALAAYQDAVNAIEDGGRNVQTNGRVALAHLNYATLNAGSRATCVVRATVDAQLLKLDLDTHAQPQGETTVEGTIKVLESRLALLQSCIENVNTARKALDDQFAAIVSNGQAAVNALRAHVAGDAA